MESKPTSSSSLKTNALAKLRRLKIEENVLLQNLQKLNTKTYNQGFETLESESTLDSQYKIILKKLRDSYISLRNLLDDVKTISVSQELLAEIDLDEVKSKVLELEKSLKSTKNYLYTELNSLKTAEQEIIQEISDISLNETRDKKRPKNTLGNLNLVVPSPVRLLMTSPFKCKEVQEFQDFMSNSPNRYGGWIEYNHNLFVKYWQKYFRDDENIDTDSSHLALENFIDEVLMKTQGLDKSSIISHIEWYKKYIFLKNRQQKALDKWKSNKTTIKKACKHVSKTFGGVIKDQISNQTTARRKVLDEDDIRRLMKPTAQWISRSEDQTPTKTQPNHIEDIKRLRTPNWRLCL